jgi:hypothetical protein
MQAQNINHLFTRFTFQKTTSEIVTKAKTQISRLYAKIEERQQRVNTLRSTYQITDAAFADILTQMRENDRKNNHVQNYSTRTTDNQGVAKEIQIGAGVVNNLLTESDFITAERQQIERLTFIVNNLRDVQKTSSNGTSYVEPHVLSFEELEFLGF